MARKWSVACSAIACCGLFFTAPILAQHPRRPIPPRRLLRPNPTYGYIYPVPRPFVSYIYPTLPPLIQPPNTIPLIYRPIGRDRKEGERLTTVGDRFFRAKNYKRAKERYEQACRVD